MFNRAMLGPRMVLGAILIAACSRGSQTVFEVESLRQHVPELMQAARAWRSDAYLETATVRLAGEHAPSDLLSAHIVSPSEEFDSLAIRLLADGSVSVGPLPQSVAIRYLDPIEDSDWSIDSPEAFDRALDDEGRRFLSGLESANCSLLILEREDWEPGARVVWRLLLTPCDDASVRQTTIIDATTGELISRESHMPNVTQ